MPDDKAPRDPAAPAAPAAATPDGARAPDDYEAMYMAGEGVLYRDKIKAPKAYFLLFLLPILVQIIALGAAALAGGPVPASTFVILPLTSLLVAMIGLLFSVLRITVTAREVIVQYGLFGPKIPISAIGDCRAIKYNWMNYGGWGIRRGRDGSWAYNMIGDAGRAVCIDWTDANGKAQTTLLASPNPDGLAHAINEARARAGAPVPASRLRVAKDPSMGEVDAEAEAEAAAEAAAALADVEEEKRGKG